MQDEGPDAEWVTAAEAARRLGIKRATLYAYVSRGQVRSRAVPRSRTRLYHGGDLRELKVRHDARAGHGAVAAAALRWGEPVLDSSITEIRAQGPAYRGQLAVELARRGVSFERTAELLWTGKLPARAAWRSTYQLPIAALAPLVTQKARPIDGLLLALSSLASSPMHHDASSPAARLTFARQALLELAAACALARGAQACQRARRESGVARRLLVALGGKPHAHAERVIEAALVLCADHELNASTFVCRVATSAGADLSRALLAALATITGTRHGGTTEQVEALVQSVGRPEHAVRAIAEQVRNQEPTLGYGHRLYPAGDPRTLPLLELLERSPARSLPYLTLSALMDAVELAGGEAATLDVALVAVALALELCPGAALAIFAVGRVAGWVAHAEEQLAQGVILRPRARYVPAPS